MREVYIDGQKCRLNDKDILGVGGEAEVYRWQNKALKIFHNPPVKTTAAEKREWQKARQIKIAKLKNFPTNLPSAVLAPEKNILDAGGEIIGYAMPFIPDTEALTMLANKKYREANVGNDETLKIFRNLLQTLQIVHQKQVIVGDFNDLNILFKGVNAYFIDTDSLQFGGYPCLVATERFLDPNLFGKNFSLAPTFNKESDYYAYAIMLFQSLLFVHPYGGIHPKIPTLLKRAEAVVSVFDKEVKYPKAALHYSILPDELLEYFNKIFSKGERLAFIEKLLIDCQWKKCPTCGLVHARPRCPDCQIGPVKEAIVVRGKVTASRIFTTNGVILFATLQNGQLKFVYSENDEVRRENRQLVLKQKATRDMRFGIMNETTLVGKQNKIVIIKNEKVIDSVDTGVLGSWPVFDANEAEYFHLSADYLAKNNHQVIGQILENQTWFKVGSTFGFGFYRVGQKIIHFVFDAHSGALDDSVKLPEIKGKLIDADCFFNNDYALFTTSCLENGKVINAMYLIRRDGTQKASAEEEADNSRMLKNIHGKALGGTNILCATDEGLLLIVPENGQLVESKIFSDTEPFVNEQSEIYPANNGVYIVSPKDVKFLRLG